MIRALDDAAARGEPYDLSSLFLVISSGVMWSAPVKAALMAHQPVICLDSLGSSEGVGFANNLTAPGQEARTAKFTIGEHTKVFTEDGREVEPGSGELGMLSLGGHLPAGYYKDPDKSAHTFRIVRRRALLGPGRLGDRRDRRDDHVARPRLGEHQLGRREDLPRRGRGSREGRRRGARLRRRRRPRRPLRRSRHRGHRRRRRRHRRRSRRSSKPAASSPTSNAPSTSSVSTRSREAPTAKPTTNGPSKPPPRHSPSLPEHELGHPAIV